MKRLGRIYSTDLGDSDVFGYPQYDNNPIKTQNYNFVEKDFTPRQL